MAAITAAEVFEFMGTPNDQQTIYSAGVDSLIERTVKELESKIGRKVEKETITGVLFQYGLNCVICGRKLYLKGKYRDLYSISSITEEGTTLTAITAHDDGNDYYLNDRLGIIHRKGDNWSTEFFATAISGDIGLTDPDDRTKTRSDVKQILIEMVAAKSGLWKINIQTAEGTVTQVKTYLSKDTKEAIEILKIKDIM